MKERLLYYSTNYKAPHVTFRDALLKGLAPDGGLYMPLHLPEISITELEALPSMDFPGVSSLILGHLTSGELEEEEIGRICRDIYRFEVPVEKVTDTNYILRLDQGPTASFKDFAALFMGRIMQYFLAIENQFISILTATSGDTGSAVANAYYGLENIKVIILFPIGEVTDVQRKQMTTLNKNVYPVAIKGKFDDCQRLVKQAFMDPALSHLRLSSANSINIGRLLPQSIYYFWAWSKLSGNTREPVIFSVPCGNFGNLTGGLIAKGMGLPVKKFVISTNENNEVPEFLRTGHYHPLSPSRNCISSAMNVGHPSNLARIIDMYGGRMDEKGRITKTPDITLMRKEMYAVSVSDRETRDTIHQCFKQYNTVLEPHGAVAWSGLQKFLLQSGTEYEDIPGVSIETAHPAKFRDEINQLINFSPHLPESLLKIEGKKEDYISLENNYSAFTKLIAELY